ncbi:MAG: NAD(P)H-hydrate epimerase [Planctomycetota bacterium]|nr:NAD(P)H-hydrate epimerase [Planctomycetota bacterium]
MRSLTRDEVRAVDQTALEEFGLPGIVLMENAGRGAAYMVFELGITGKVLICAGKGNNGGDGFVIARHLDLWGVVVEVVLSCEPAELTGDAAVNCRVAQAAGIPIRVWNRNVAPADFAESLSECDWIVDALLGTGARGAPREPIASMIQAINASQRRVFAVDIPSGLDCDTGRAEGVCIRATATATFVAPKLGFSAPDAEQFTGSIYVIDIGIPRRLRDRVLGAG